MGEVILMNGKNNGNIWKSRVEKAKVDYEQELERKKKLYDESGDTGVFTPEDIDDMASENEMFHSKKVNFSQVQKYNRLAEAARFLDSKHGDILKVDCPPLPTGRAGCIYVDINNLSIFANDDVKNTLAGMIAMCDNFTISAVRDDNVTHLSFFVRDLRVK